jgi:carbonic anhydrase
MNPMSHRGTRLAVLAASLAGLALIALTAPVQSGAAPIYAPTSIPVAATTAQPDAASTWTHNPALPDGPTHWATLTPDWAACAGDGDQSPIVINHGRPASLPPLQVEYPRVPLVVENTGHVVEVHQPAGESGTLRYGTATYRLVQWHLHAPSEHVVNGRRYDMEIHLVHQSDRGATVVLAILADIARHGRDAPPPGRGTAQLLRRTLRAAPEKAGEETDTGTAASAIALLPPGTHHAGRTSAVVTDYLTYRGSLTTPPCTTGVSWLILPTPARVDANTVERMHTLVAEFPGYDGYPDNNRPVQPLGTRTVQRRDG